MIRVGLLLIEDQIPLLIVSLELTTCSYLNAITQIGGPIIIKGSNPSEDIQVGVSSWGYGCASPDFPGV